MLEIALRVLILGRIFCSGLGDYLSEGRGKGSRDGDEVVRWLVWKTGLISEYDYAPSLGEQCAPVKGLWQDHGLVYIEGDHWETVVAELG